MAEASEDHARAADQPTDGDARAEQRLEEWGRRVGRFLTETAARAREEAEDIFAEAQSIRRGERE